MRKCATLWFAGTPYDKMYILSDVVVQCDTQTDRQTDRQTDKQTDRQTDRQIHRQIL
jgi:hypothetical protein